MFARLQTLNLVNELIEKCRALAKEAESNGMILQARHLALIIRELEIINRKILNGHHEDDLDINQKLEFVKQEIDWIEQELK